MEYCPVCGRKLEPAEVENHKISKCSCGYIDWDNWVNLSAVSVAYNDEGQFMMVHLKGKSKGKITFPGGFRNLGESLEQAAIRECYEESGYQIDHLELYKIYTKDELRLVWVVYKAKIKGGTFIENNETEKIGFYSLDNLPDLANLRGNLTRQLLDDLVKENI